jgi:hypothetical protein
MLFLMHWLGGWHYFEGEGESDHQHDTRGDKKQYVMVVLKMETHLASIPNVMTIVSWVFLYLKAIHDRVKCEVSSRQKEGLTING